MMSSSHAQSKHLKEMAFIWFESLQATSMQWHLNLIKTVQPFCMQLQLYTCGEGYCGALGHGDEIDKTTPELMNRLKSYLAVQVWFVHLFIISDEVIIIIIFECQLLF